MKLRKGSVFTGVCRGGGSGGWLSLVPCPFQGFISLVPGSPRHQGGAAWQIAYQLKITDEVDYHWF